MNSKPNCEKLVLKESVTDSLFLLLEKRREEKDLNSELKQLLGELKSLDTSVEELQKEFKDAQEFDLSFERFLEEEHANELVETVERETQELVDLEEENERLKTEMAELKKQNKQLELEVQEYTVYYEFLEKVLKSTPFKDVESLAAYLERLQDFNEKMSREQSETQERLKQMKEALGKIQDDHEVTMLDCKNRLSQLKTEHNEVDADIQELENKWNLMRKTTARKTLELGQMKIAILNLYEMTGSKLDTEEGIGINDTEEQLDAVQAFMEDTEDILKSYQLMQQGDAESDSSESQRRPKHTPARARKHIKHTTRSPHGVRSLQVLPQYSRKK